MVFSEEVGCQLLHRTMDDGTVDWFANHDFAHLIQQSLYDITCPGWCGILGEMTLDTGEVTVSQPREVSIHTVATQIAWVSYFFLIIHFKVDHIRVASTRCTILH